MTMNEMNKPLKVAFVSTFPPRKCGIATFTSDLYKSIKNINGNEDLNQPDNELQVIALNNVPEGYPYSKEVSFAIRERYREDYRRAADYINLSPIDVVNLQHEYGIFGGGEEGSYILYLLGKLKKPVVTTLHTITENPLPSYKKTLQKVCSYSTKLIVLADKAVQILQDVYGVPEQKIEMIHHGVHDVPFLDPFYYKGQFNAEGRPVILTFGLLHANKGLEYVIEALPGVVEKFPDVIFIILGATHPEIKKKYGEKYRHSLQKMVSDYKISRNVVFHNHFVSLEQLKQFLLAADIYITPYLGKEQISSGTLAFALSAGKAIISTPYHYANDLLGDERGILVPFEDSKAIAEKLILLIEDDNLRNRLRKNAYEYGRQMVWGEVANAYMNAFEQALYDYGDLMVVDPAEANFLSEPIVLPEVNLRQLQMLTDDTGLFHHAVYTIPDRSHGYSTDDNARALAVAVMNWNLFRDEAILPLLNNYLSFLNNAFDPETGNIRSHLSFNREWSEERTSEETHGRAIWALGHAVAYPPTEAVLGFSVRLFKQLIESTHKFKSPRAWSYIIIGALRYLERFGGETQMHKAVTRFSRRLFNQFSKKASEEWPWCENTVTYDNPRLPEALIAAGQYLDKQEMIDRGLETLEWLIEIQTDKVGGHPSFIGDQEWYMNGKEKSRFDQRPLEASAIIGACHQAYLTTGDSVWRERMEWAFNWYFGNNDVRQPLYDFSTGGCFDGLQPAGINENQGGESVVSFLLSLHRMHQLAHQHALNESRERKEKEEKEEEETVELEESRS